MARHLIHIGYPKTGSTFLQAWFERHPEIRYAPGGLGGFRNVYEMARPSGNAFKYFVTSHEDITAPRAESGEVALEVVTGWMTHAERMKEEQAGVCAVLKSFFPGGLVLLMTRGFRGMVRSGYSQYVRTGGVIHTSKTLPGGVRADALRYAAALYDFDFIIRLYGEAFGEENLIILPYELLRDDQRRFLAALESRLGLEHVETDLGRVNPSLSPEELYWYPVISRAVSAVTSRLGPAVHRKVFGWYVGQTLDNRLRHLVKVLRRLSPGKKITDADFPEDILEHCRGKATLLKDDPLYAPYAAEYLWDS